MRKALLLVLALACGHRHDDKPVQAAVPPLGSAQDVAEPPPAALPPAADLLGAVPADAAFAFVALDPSDLPRRIFAELDGKVVAEAARAALSTPDPIARVEYAAWAELGGAMATPDPLRALGIGRRLAVFGVGRIEVLRVELADRAMGGATLARVMKAAGQAGPGPTWTIDTGGSALLAAIAGNQLVIAHGPRDAIHGATTWLLGAAATPVTEPDLRKLASEHGLDPRGIGWIDPGKLAAVVRQQGALPELDPPACRAQVAALLASFDRITFGVSELSPTRIGLMAAVPVDPQTAAAFAAVCKGAPSLPAGLPGKPIVAVSYVAPPPVLSTAWTELGNKINAACDPNSKSWSLPAPWNSITAAAFAVYGGEWKSILPDSIDGIAAVASPDPDKLLAAIGKAVPIAVPPKDGGPFVDVPAAALGGFAPELALARRGQVLVAASGPLGKAHATDFATGTPAPLFRLVLDLARMRRPDDATRDDDDAYYTAGGSFGDRIGATKMLFALFGTMSLAIEIHGGEIRVQLSGDAGPHQAAAKPPADPRAPVREQCRAILRHALGGTAPALAKLGVTEQLDEIATTYATSIEADGAIRSCAKLTAAQRACLAAAPDVLAAAKTCAPGPDGFRDSKLELPPLFSFFGPRPLEAKLHPPIDGKALVGKLAGAWVRKDDFRTETWVVDGSGNVAITKQETGSAAETEHGKLVADTAGAIEITQDDGSSRSSFFMPGADRFFEGNGGDLAPISSTDRFLAPLGDGFVIREPGGCWVVTREGALVNAICKADKQDLVVTYAGHDAKYKLFPGWVVDADIVDGSPFVRQR